MRCSSRANMRVAVELRAGRRRRRRREDEAMGNTGFFLFLLVLGMFGLDRIVFCVIAFIRSRWW